MKRDLFISILTLSLFLGFGTSGNGYEIPRPKESSPQSENLRFLQQLSSGVSELANISSQAIVFVSVSKTIKGMPFGEINPFEFFFGPQFRGNPRQPQPERKQKGLGSGFFIDLEKGYILTNNHVIEQADEISLKLANGHQYDAKVLGRDKNTDVAVVQIKDKDFKRDGLTALQLSDSDTIKVGEFVIALGAPFGLEASLSFGVLSAIGRGNLEITNLGNFIQTDAAINPGNSGGPLLNMKGHVIGINTAIYSRSGGSAGIGFSVPSNLVRTIATQLIESGKVARGYLGVQLSQELNEEIVSGLDLPEGTKGALVSKVQPGTPAADAKLEEGDVITKVDKRRVKNNSELRNVIGLLKPGSDVKLEIYRNGKKRFLNLELGEFPEEALASQGKNQNFGDSGLSLQRLNPAVHDDWIERYGITSKKGLLVTHVEPNSKAYNAGLKAGDVLLKVNRKSLSHPKEFRKFFKNKKKLLIQLERNGTFLFATMRKD